MTENCDKNLTEHLQQFASQHATHRPIVLVTSGGTCTDLEVNSVRSLDNFSTGFRGALSVEAFLAKGYAVVHLQRTGSASPFACNLSRELAIGVNQALSVAAFDKMFSVGGSDSGSLSDHLEVKSKIANSSLIKEAVRNMTRALDHNLLYTITFRTVEEYLHLLELAARTLSVMDRLLLIYLAAAVSDFYVPKEDRSEHKIQSGDNDGLTLHLKPVPKMLQHLTSDWCPSAFVVSFKLETDENILMKKSNGAIEKYGVNLVVANELYTRQKRVWIVDAEGNDQKTANSTLIEKLEGLTLEELITDFVTEKHFKFISKGNPTLTLSSSSLSRIQYTPKDPKSLWKNKKWLVNVLEVSGPIIGAILSYYLSQFLNKQRRWK